jgi:hypothetical protein
MPTSKTKGHRDRRSDGGSGAEPVTDEIKRLRLMGIGGAAVLAVFFTALGLDAASIASSVRRSSASCSRRGVHGARPAGVEYLDEYRRATRACSKSPRDLPREGPSRR